MSTFQLDTNKLFHFWLEKKKPLLANTCIKYKKTYNHVLDNATHVTSFKKVTLRKHSGNTAFQDENLAKNLHLHLLDQVVGWSSSQTATVWRVKRVWI